MRAELARKLAFGVRGCFQNLACQGLAEDMGEDAALIAAVQILNAQNAYKGATTKPHPIRRRFSPGLSAVCSLHSNRLGPMKSRSLF